MHTYEMDVLFRRPGVEEREFVLVRASILTHVHTARDCGTFDVEALDLRILLEPLAQPLSRRRESIISDWCRCVHSPVIYRVRECFEGVISWWSFLCSW